MNIIVVDFITQHNEEKEEEEEEEKEEEEEVDGDVEVVEFD